MQANKCPWEGLTPWALSVEEAGRVTCLTPRSSAGARETQPLRVSGAPGGTHFFRGACLPLTGFFGACLATAAPGESQDEVGVFGVSAASDFWFGKGARGPLLASLIFSSSAFMVLRIAFPVFLFSVGTGWRERFLGDSVSQFLDRQQPPNTGFERIQGQSAGGSSALA